MRATVGPAAGPGATHPDRRSGDVRATRSPPSGTGRLASQVPCWALRYRGVDISESSGPSRSAGRASNLTGPGDGPWAAVVERTPRRPDHAGRRGSRHAAPVCGGPPDDGLPGPGHPLGAGRRPDRDAVGGGGRGTIRPSGRRAAALAPARRAHPRARGLVARLGGGHDDVVAARTENISTAGALLATAEAMDVGRLLLMEMGEDGSERPALGDGSCAATRTPAASSPGGWPSPSWTSAEASRTACAASSSTAGDPRTGAPAERVR